MNTPGTIALLAAARPNYMKVFPLIRELKAWENRFRPVLIHTGQHYDGLMNDIFFEDFEVAQPDHYLGIGSGPHGVQTAKIMIALEMLFDQQRPDLLLVVGDVNSTMAGALTSVKMGIPVVHLEAGLRSYDRSMPEEINRIVTDSISDLLLTSCRDANENLWREGVSKERIRFVGNIMIDSLSHILPKAEAADTVSRLRLKSGDYCLVTLHRPSNVDDGKRLSLVMRQLSDLSATMPVVFPVHPRTRKTLQSLDGHGSRLGSLPGLHLIDPLGYIDFLALQLSAAVVVTDSGGIQEETTYLGIPCLTVRPNTERPVTIERGTNRLVEPATDPLDEILPEHIAFVRSKSRPQIEGWDGRTAGRVVRELLQFGK